MKAIVAEQAGGPEVLQLQDVEQPEIESHEVLVETLAIGVNFIETYQRSGVYPVDFPFTPGSEAIGRVIAVGHAVLGIEPGDRVATAAGTKTYAQRFAVAHTQVARIPDSIDDATAAALPLQGCTAHYLATDSARPEAGETVLVHAGAGGVGLLLTQLLVARGVRVLTTASTEEKRALSVEAGAAESFGYENFAARTRELTGGEGAAVVYDGVGASTIDQSLEAARVRGEIVLFGGASGQVPPFDLQRLAAGGSLKITRPSLGHFMRSADERESRYRELFSRTADGSLKVRVGATYALADAADAHRALAGRETTGKIVLLP